MTATISHDQKATIRVFGVRKLFMAIAPAICCCSLACGDVLFYAGDAANLGGLANSGGYIGYDAFTVPAGGWEVSSVFSNNQVPNIPLPYTATGGTWEIWTDLGQADQTLVASGSTVTNFSWTPTGRSGADVSFPEYTLSLSGLDIDLAPGTYWLGVSPIISDSGTAYISGTGGENAVGSPVGSSGSAVLQYEGATLFPSTDFNAGMFDLSMGIDGAAVPEPAMFVPAAAVMLAVLRRRRRTGKFK
jgi:hypothetical protein